MKVGDYVRTNLRGEIVIRKVIDIIHSTSMNDNRMVFDKPTKFTYYVEDNKNYKTSDKHIDLIEVGDYVNGEKVIALEKDIDKRNIYPSNVGAKIFTDYEFQGNWYFGIQEEEIKSIVTKEQFEDCMYNVGD